MSILRVPLKKTKIILTLAIQLQHYLVVLLITFLKRLPRKHLIIKHNNSTNQLTSFPVRKIFTDNTIIIYKNNNKNDYKS